MYMDSAGSNTSMSAVSWTEVTATGPPARQAHSAVVYNSSMYFYGGERSAYEYSDIWKFEPMSEEWTFVSPMNDSAPARHDHSAVVYGDYMYVYGGRGPQPLGDHWRYSFPDCTWEAMPTSSGMPARFGHTAVVVNNTMLVYGGYVASEGGLSDELWSFDFDTMEWTLLGPRDSNFDEYGTTPYVADPSDAIQFPADIPEARFSHVALTVGDGMYIFGGAGGPTMKVPLEDAWFYDAIEKTWTPIYESTGLARYDSAVAAYTIHGTSPYMFVFGGHGPSGFLADTQMCFAVHQGL